MMYEVGTAVATCTHSDTKQNGNHADSFCNYGGFIRLDSQEGEVW